MDHDFVKDFYPYFHAFKKAQGQWNKNRKRGSPLYPLSITSHNIIDLAMHEVLIKVVLLVSRAVDNCCYENVTLMKYLCSGLEVLMKGGPDVFLQSFSCYSPDTF